MTDLENTESEYFEAMKKMATECWNKRMEEFRLDHLNGGHPSTLFLEGFRMGAAWSIRYWADEFKKQLADETDGEPSSK